MSEARGKRNVTQHAIVGLVSEARDGTHVQDIGRMKDEQISSFTLQHYTGHIFHRFKRMMFLYSAPYSGFTFAVVALISA